ncbi:hypothetical protein K491DRAFT_698150 [Lophiostoma macrostomum CBS 122681]|uniref:Mitochondrial F1F0-ATP synthase g subunit n=1 Tax=Lophiostoma macrostomum CBS 122681 TaxID=1314788 RepID=A0A6A6SS27_9PLEO|nr:hypothetical protein K491DRAFT_698150 [Lophiostoma macrostomum CBS 122681]
MGKVVARERKMSPPDVSAFQGYVQPLLNGLRNPSSLLQRAPTSGAEQTNVLNQVRNMSREQWTTVGVVAAEVVGFFSIGEMIGRWKIVGYRHTGEAHH